MRRYAVLPFSIVHALADCVQALLAVRFLLVLFGANPAVPAVRFVGTLTDRLVAPFSGIFPDTVLGALRVEWSTVAAMVVYAVLAALIIRLLGLAVPEDDAGTHGGLHA